MPGLIRATFRGWRRGWGRGVAERRGEIPAGLHTIGRWHVDLLVGTFSGDLEKLAELHPVSVRPEDYGQSWVTLAVDATTATMAARVGTRIADRLDVVTFRSPSARRPGARGPWLD